MRSLPRHLTYLELVIIVIARLTNYSYVVTRMTAAIDLPLTLVSRSLGTKSTGRKPVFDVQFTTVHRVNTGYDPICSSVVI